MGGRFRPRSSGWFGSFAGFINGAKMNSVHEKPNIPKGFDTQEAVEEVLNMLENRNAAAIQAWLFIRVLTKALAKKYNFKLW